MNFIEIQASGNPWVLSGSIPCYLKSFRQFYVFHFSHGNMIFCDLGVDVDGFVGDLGVDVDGFLVILGSMFMYFL